MTAEVMPSVGYVECAHPREGNTRVPAVDGPRRQPAEDDGRRTRAWADRAATSVQQSWQRDWSEHCREHDHRVAGWVRRHPVLQGCTDLTAVLDAVHDDPDGVLGVLISEDQAGCPAAARVVLESMLPKMLRMAARDPRTQLSDYLAYLWLVIRRYPLSRRPQRIAANLVLDTMKQVYAERDEGLLPVEDQRLDQLRMRADLSWQGVEPLTARDILAAAELIGLIDHRTRALMCSVYAEGLRGDRAARRHKLGHAALRQRCSVTVRLLAAHADELVAVA